jgi:hypothetical protein
MSQSFKQSLALPACLLSTLMLALAPAQADDVPFVEDAIAKAKEAPTAEGRWEVTASVRFASEKSGDMVASGPIAFEGTPVNGLKGIIPMQVGDDAETNKTNALGLVVKPDGTVGIQWLIAGKPYLGRPTFVFKPSVFPDYFSKLINFGGAARRMKLTLASEWIKANKPGIRKPPQPTETKEGKAPIGKRYKLTGRLVVTNSEDGFLDNTCEIEGKLTYRRGSNLKGRFEWDKVNNPCMTIISQDADKGFTLSFDKNIILDHIFAKPETEYLQIRALIYDHDDESGSESMSVGDTRPFSLASLAKKNEERNLPGDRDSENVEVYYTVTFVKDLY